MKKTIFSFLILFLLTAEHIFAATNSLNVNYPASYGKYKTVRLTNLQTTSVDCTQAANAGVTWQDPTSGNFMTCIQNQSVPQLTNGQTTIQPQECFNAFCTYNGAPGSGSCIPGGLVQDSSSPYFPCGYPPWYPKGLVEQVVIYNDPHGNTDADVNLVNVVCCTMVNTSGTTTNNPFATP